LRSETFLWEKNVIWAGFGPIGNTEKKEVWADYVAVFFQFSPLKGP
jgi:hypothetical protein